MTQQSQPTIFVAIASYNDPMLPHTLDQCLANARYPENLRFGICWQSDSREPIDLRRFKRDPRFQFREYSTDESEGGSWARNIAQRMWDGETYTMQVDSHMAFAYGWDTQLVRMMRDFPADKPLISMIAPLFDWKDGHVIKRSDMGLCVSAVSQWDADNAWAPWFDWGCAVHGGPVRNRFLSGMFIFTQGQWNEEVRQDPKHYYWGEEFALALRSYTHGYDFFLPNDYVIWHMHHTQAPPRRHWEHGSEVVRKKNEIAFERLHKLAFSDDAKASDALGRYGLGSQRSRRDFERYSGMNFATKKAHPDVFDGRPPDPVTIKSDADWDACVTFADYKQRDGHQ